MLGDLLAAQPPEVLLFGATRLADELAPRLAQRFNTGLLAHCISLQMDDMERMLIGTHPVFEGEYYEAGRVPVGSTGDRDRRAECLWPAVSRLVSLWRDRDGGG